MIWATEMTGWGWWERRRILAVPLCHQSRCCRRGLTGTSDADIPMVKYPQRTHLRDCAACVPSVIMIVNILSLPRPIRRTTWMCVLSPLIAVNIGNTGPRTGPGIQVSSPRPFAVPTVSGKTVSPRSDKDTSVRSDMRWSCRVSADLHAMQGPWWCRRCDGVSSHRKICRCGRRVNAQGQPTRPVGSTAVYEY